MSQWWILARFKVVHACKIFRLVEMYSLLRYFADDKYNHDCLISCHNSGQLDAHDESVLFIHVGYGSKYTPSEIPW